MKTMRNTCILLATLLSITATGALAQAKPAASGSLPAERFRSSLSREGFFDVEDAAVPKHLEYDVGLFLGYQNDPLVLQVRDNGLLRQGSIVGHRVGANLVGSLALFDFLQLGVELPVVLYQASTISDATLLKYIPELPALAVGDVRLVPKLQLLRQKSMAVDLSILAGFTLPTNAPAGSYAGEPLPTFQPEVAVGRSLLNGGALRLDGNVGFRFRSPSRLLDLEVGQELTYRAGANYSLQSMMKMPLRVGVNASGAVGLNAPFSNINANPLEVLGGATYDIGSSIQVGAALGLGVIGGYGVPDFRIMGNVRWSPRQHDKDQDGINDSDDACPEVAEDKDGFEDSDGCADADNDQDGVLDGDDLAPNDPEDPDDFEDADGKPDPDNDQDGILDSDDRCPNKPGVKEEGGCPAVIKDRDHDGVLDADDVCVDVPGTAAMKGCPDGDNDGVADASDVCPTVPGLAAHNGCPDTDGDGLPDTVDKCPTEPETINGVDDGDGCPDKGKTLVKVTAEKVEIMEKVFFDVNKATLQRRSFGLLDQVAAVLKNNTQISKVRVEGHTDSDGDDARNLNLSQDRADAVRKYLIDKGVSADRLEAKGFGETQPVVPNSSKNNKEQNRRVEFRIVNVGG